MGGIGEYVTKKDVKIMFISHSMRMISNAQRSKNYPVSLSSFFRNDSVSSSWGFGIILYLAQTP
jgi:hypothetical protein